MAAPPLKDPDRPRRLSQALSKISELKAQLSGGPPIKPAPTAPGGGTKPIPKDPGTGKPGPLPPVTKPGSPGTYDPSSMAPKPLADYLENQSNADLCVLLSSETAKDRKHQDSRVVGAVYHELKKRRKS